MTAAIVDLVQSFPSLRVAIVGEAMLDSYLHGTADRLSREAPVPIVTLDGRIDAPGGAANAAANVAALGARPSLISIAGTDGEGERLRVSLDRLGVETDGLLAVRGRRTLAKQRVIAADQMLLRFDTGSVEPPPADAEDRLIEVVAEVAARSDLVVLSDYGYGVVSERLISALVELRDRLPPVVVDAKDLRRHRRLRPNAVKPNYGEACRLLGEREADTSAARERQIAASGERLLDVTGAQIAAVTIDTDGAFVFERGAPLHRTYARPASHSRAAGAGDTFVAAFALAIAAGAAAPVAAEIASAAAAIVVAKPGTSTCGLDELVGAFGGGGKLIPSDEELRRLVRGWRAAGRQVVFTNGCFDILHRGHVSYLNRAKGLGDVLLVAVNSDSSVRRLKGQDRPVNGLEDRLSVLAALSCVDHVIAFDDPSPERLIRAIRPDLFVKGGDYAYDSLPEAPLVEELGGTVRILPYLEERSTSSLIARLRDTADDPRQPGNAGRTGVPRDGGRKAIEAPPR
jgi:D-beta-D-heptose 7-phosphate kinase/D-beta-D-heptose 1-phosphate adenosyltransferase